MGRKLMRVPLDFNYPLNQVWTGYKNPHIGYFTCAACGGRGTNLLTRKIEDEFYAHGLDRRLRWCDNITQDEVQALLDKGRLMDLTHRWDKEQNRYVPTGHIPTAGEVNAWERSSFGHDGINRGILVKCRATRLGVFGLCPTCDGEGCVQNPDAREFAAYEAWTRYDPPTGEGYQLWKTTGEESPASPVFAELDALCAWCESGASVFGNSRATAAEWRTMLVEDDVQLVVDIPGGKAVFL